MNPSNRTIEEKLAIVQQLRNNASSTLAKPTDKTLKTTKYTHSLQSTQTQSQPEETSPFLAFLIVRIIICFILFGVIVFAGSKNPALKHYVNAIITTEENGNLIDFMSPFTYTLQENIESTSDTNSETQDSESAEPSVPSEE